MSARVPAVRGLLALGLTTLLPAVAWAQVDSAVRGLNIPIMESIEFFDIFRGKQVPPGKKSIAFSLTFRAPDRTLTSEEVETARQACIQSLTAIGAQLRG